jgi:xanthine dehydrogenase accessory factor
MHALSEVVTGWLADGLRVALVRPIDAVGFGARWPGEALAIASDGQRAGGVLGGAVDDAALPLATAVARGEGRSPVRLDVPVDAHGAASCGLSCSGEAHLLVQDAAELPAELWEALADGRHVALTTTIGAGPSAVADDEAVRTLTGRRPTGRSDGRFVTTDDGTEVAVEWWVPTGRLIVTGAEGLSAAVVAQARLLGWEADALDPDEAGVAALAAGPADAVIVLTHDHAVDAPILMSALGGRAGYIGAIGSRGTQVDRARRLAAAGADDAAIARIHGPVGLDLGGTNAAETALSICAEVLATRSGRPATPLRTTSGPITG